MNQIFLPRSDRDRKRQIRKALEDGYRQIFLDGPVSVSLEKSHTCDACGIAMTREGFHLPFLFGQSTTFLLVALCTWCSGDGSQQKRAVKRVTRRGWGITT